MRSVPPFKRILQPLAKANPILSLARLHREFCESVTVLMNANPISCCGSGFRTGDASGLYPTSQIRIFPQTLRTPEQPGQADGPVSASISLASSTTGISNHKYNGKQWSGGFRMGQWHSTLPNPGHRPPDALDSHFRPNNGQFQELPGTGAALLPCAKWDYDAVHGNLDKWPDKA